MSHHTSRSCRSKQPTRTETPIEEIKRIGHSQNGNPSKINPEKVACFSSPKTNRQLPSFHQQSTTTSPPKNHIQPPIFAKTPSKNTVPPPPKKITAKAHMPPDSG